MLEAKRILAVIPARGGSKGVPFKNLRPVLGVPLVARVVDTIRQIPAIDRSVVSTDDDRIAQAATEAGLDVPFRRPPELSADRVADYPVLMHALSEMEKLDSVRYDIVLMLQPTSPLRRAQHVRDAIEMLIRGGWDAVWTVSMSNPKYHPLKQLRVSGDQLSYYDPRGSQVVARQELEPLFYRNGAAYAVTRDCLVDQQSIMGQKTGALVIEDEMISIDTAEDFERVEFLLRQRQ